MTQLVSFYFQFFYENFDFYFLFPNFMKIKIPIKSPITDQVLFNAKLNWLSLSIKNLYSKQADLELQALEQHLKLVKSLPSLLQDEFDLKFQSILQTIEFKRIKKHQKLDKKFSCLKLKQQSDFNQQRPIDRNVFPHQILIHNMSPETFRVSTAER